MRGLYFNGDALEFCTDLPDPVARAHEVIVETQLAGICETDLQLVQGYMGFRGILGHEFVGVPRSGRYVGQRVVGEINCCPVERCAACPENRSHCARRTVLGILQHDGAFADRVAVPEDNLHPLPDTITNEQAVFVEPLAAAFQIREQVPIAATDRVLVLGDGRLGYLIAQVLAEATNNLTVVGKHATKLQRFDDRGLQTVRLADLPEAWFADRTVDVVVDCTGHESGFSLALQLVRPRGTVVLKTTIAGLQSVALAPIVIDEIRIVGSRCGPFPQAITALAEGRIETASLITARHTLSDGVNAFAVAAEPQHHKVLLDVV